MNKMPAAKSIVINLVDGSCVEISEVSLVVVSVEVLGPLGPSHMMMEAIVGNVEHVIPNLKEKRNETSN